MCRELPTGVCRIGCPAASNGGTAWGGAGVGAVPATVAGVGAGGRAPRGRARLRGVPQRL